MKKVLYIKSRFGLGGINKIVSVKENYLVNHGYEIHNLSSLAQELVSPKGMYDDKIVQHFIQLDDLNRLRSIPIIGIFMRYFYYRWKMISIIMRINPDVIIVTEPLLEPLSVILLSFGKKRIMELHGWYNNPDRSFTLRDKLTFKLKFPFYQIVVLTDGEVKRIRKISNNDAIFISNPQFSFPQKTSNCENKRVITLARFTAQKNLPSILPYWKKVQENHPDWELHIFGEGPDEQEMRDIIHREQLCTVFIHPYTNQVEEELAKSSIYLFPSKFEGFPLVLLECMSVGVPCVAYDCPFGPSEIIRNGEDGFVTEYMNPQRFIDKILVLIENDELRKEMGVKAREHIISSYNMDDIMKQWMTLIND